MKKYDLLMLYFLNERDRLAAEVAQLQENIRYRRISSVDCLELIIAQERLSAFVDFSENVKVLLRLKNADSIADRKENVDDDSKKES